MIKKLIKLAIAMKTNGFEEEAVALEGLITGLESDEIKTFWVSRSPGSEEGYSLPIYAKKKDYGWEVGPADWMMQGDERWYDENEGKPQVQRLENFGFVFKDGEYSRLKLHRGSRTHAGNI